MTNEIGNKKNNFIFSIDKLKKYGIIRRILSTSYQQVNIYFNNHQIVPCGTI